MAERSSLQGALLSSHQGHLPYSSSEVKVGLSLSEVRLTDTVQALLSVRSLGRLLNAHWVVCSVFTGWSAQCSLGGPLAPHWVVHSPLTGWSTQALTPHWVVHSPLTGWFTHPSLSGLLSAHWVVCSPPTGWSAHPSLGGLLTPHWVVCSPLTGWSAYRAYTPAAGHPSTVWFDRTKISPFVPEHTETMENACDVIKKLIEKEESCGIQQDHIVLGGYFCWTNRIFF